MTDQLFGIDFGTTNSLAALVVGDEVRSLVDERDNRPHPSVVWYRGTEVIVGRDARKHLDSMQATAAHEPVRSPKMALRRDGPLHIDGRAIDPSDVVAEVLRYIKRNAAARRPRGYDLAQAVMTVPVDFGGPQRRALRDAARKAGIGVIQFVHEPAAALYAHLRSKADVQRALADLENRNVLVFD
jgi:molecular chaperone DnaK